MLSIVPMSSCCAVFNLSFISDVFMCIVVRRVTQTAVLYQSIRSTNEIFVVAVAV